MTMHTIPNPHVIMLARRSKARRQSSWYRADKQAAHTTRNGVGVVGMLIKKDKSK